MIGDLTPLQKERRDKILQAAAKYFARVHYHEADMDSIARDAGVGKGTLYRYFKNKDDLYVKTIAFLTTQAFDHLHAAAASAQIFEAYVQVIIDAAIDYFVQKPDAFSIFLMSNTARIPNVLQTVEQVTKTYRDAFVQRMNKAIEKKEIRPVNPQIVYTSLIAIIINAVHSVLLKRIGTIEDFKSTIKSLVLQGLLTTNSK